MDERLKMLYPMVNEEETPLPRCWSTKVRREERSVAMIADSFSFPG